MTGYVPGHEHNKDSLRKTRNPRQYIDAEFTEVKNEQKPDVPRVLLLSDDVHDGA